MENQASHDPFDPQSDYVPPKTDSLYVKFVDGETVEVLPLESPAVGYMYWNVQGKPVRSHEAFEEIPDDIRIDPKSGQPELIKHFWAFPVYEFETRKVKVLEVTQKGIRDAILAYTRNPKWGRPVLKYSFTIKREDPASGPTKYTVMANPATDLPSEVGMAWENAKAKGFDITRLFAGGDPFSSEPKA